MSIFVWLLGGYFLIILVLSWWVGRKETEEDYLIAGRDRPWWNIAFSKYAGAVGAGYYVTYTGYAYEYGLNMSTLVLGIGVGYIIFAYWGAKRIKQISQEAGNIYTMGELVEYKTASRHASVILNIAVLISAILYLSIGIVAGGALMASFGVLSYEYAIILTLGAVISYLLLSGYKAVILTDVVQGVVMLVLLVVVGLGFWNSNAIPFEAVVATREIDVLLVAIFLVFGAATSFASPDRYQLTFAGKDTSALQTGFLGAFVPVIFTSLVLLMIGASMYAINASLDTNVVFAEAITQFVAPGLVPFALVMFFAGIMSSADTNLYVLASHVEKMRGVKLTRYALRWLLAIFGLITIIIVMIFRDVVELTIVAASFQVAVSFGMIYLVAGGDSKLTFLSMVYGGIIGVVVGILAFGVSPNIAALALIGNLVGWVISLIAKRILAKRV